MKIQKKILKPMLERVLPITQHRTTIPMLKCVHVKCDGTAFSVEATSIEQHMVAKAYGVGDCCDFLVNAGQLQKVVDSADEDVLFEVKGSSLIFTGQGVCELQTLPSDQFPPLPKDRFKEIVVNTQDVLKLAESVKWMLKFCRADELRMYRRAIHLLGSAKRVDANCTCGSIFARNFTPTMSGDFDVLVLQEFADHFCQMLGGDKAQLYVGEKFLKVVNAEGEWYCRLPEEKFPVNQIEEIFGSFKQIGVILPEELLPHLRICSSFATTDVRHIDFDFSLKGCKLMFNTAGDTQDTPARYEAVMPGKFAEFKLRYNIDYLLETVERLNNEGSPIVLSTKSGHLKLETEQYPTVAIGGMVRPGLESK